MIYCDTSLLVASLLPEAETERVLTWKSRQSAEPLAVSGWTVTEVSSALSLKVRSGAISLENRTEVLNLWHRLLEQNLVVVPVAAAAFELAATFTDQVELGLRAGDALHLAVASLGGYSVATLDRGMADAAIAFGLAVEALD
ncbi:MAG: type II toxin-antitoxin system VapC family toxin [Novosphingobium sp.]|nr:type II toxin-antitoxin system VapC family toxin [Novosphingobium sp.]